MTTYSKIVLTFITLITLLSCAVGFLAYRYATNVSSWQIEDRTITTEDLNDELKVSLILKNGQILDATIVPEGSPITSSVLGLKTTDGDIRVQIRNGEMVIDPASINIGSQELIDGSINIQDIKDSSINSAKIIDASIGLSDTNFKVVSSIDGVTNNGGNIDLIGEGGIEILANDSFDNILIKYNGNTILTNADTLDHQDSTFFQDISNQLTGILSTDLYSSYDDLFKEDKIDFDDDNDLITKGQLTNNDLSLNNATVRGDLSILGDIIFEGALNYDMLRLSPLNEQLALIITNGDVVSASIDALGNIFTNGDLTIRGKITTDDFDDLSEALKQTKADIEALDSSIVSGIVTCDHHAYETSSICTIYAPEGRVFNSLVITTIQKDIRVEAQLLENPNGKNSVKIIVYPEIAPANMYLNVSYIGFLK